MAALAPARLPEGLLYGVSARDPVLLAAVPVALALVVLLAALVPARRAAAADPIQALRAE